MEVEDLQPFADPIALLDRLHRPGDPSIKNSLLAALTRAGRTSDTMQSTATTVLLLALWPGLDAVHNRLRRHFTDEGDRLAAEIVGRASLACATLDLGRVNRISATVVRNVMRDIMRMRSDEWRRAAEADDVDAADLAAWPTPCQDIDALRTALGPDADLVWAVLIEGLTQRQAAATLGLSYDAARKRFQRAMARLRVTLSA